MQTFMNIRSLNRVNVENTQWPNCLLSFHLSKLKSPIKNFIIFLLLQQSRKNKWCTLFPFYWRVPNITLCGQFLFHCYEFSAIFWQLEKDDIARCLICHLKNFILSLHLTFWRKNSSYFFFEKIWFFSCFEWHRKQ